MATMAVQATLSLSRMDCMKMAMFLSQARSAAAAAAAASAPPASCPRSHHSR